ncbi:Na+/H+ antiporter NhaA [Mucilaginibacter gynuensis]|uniref:Na(+)/H(+) antiporter NhaA n=1 Tax=Mucilaginibacter gynuensis TaxID=1302236 RepID=A0ABP8GZW8_9SPHI
MAKLRRLQRAIDFIEHPSSSGIILLSCVIISLIIANSSLNDALNNILNSHPGTELSVSAWINDGLMAIFFLMAGLEIKREIVEGELSDVKKATLPVLCALGGMLFPAAIYALLNQNLTTSAGWGIPMATDIAFAIAILNVLKKFIPASLRVFLTALAIVDDLGAIVVIAVFYSQGIHYDQLLYAGGFFALLLIFNAFQIKHIVFYLIPGIFIWYFIHHSGVHATVAGVLTAMAIPVKTRSGYQPVAALEHKLSNPVNFLIIPLFALANTNIRYEGGMLGELFSPLGLGVICGLVLGKPLGILLMAWAAVKSKLSKLPVQANWIHMAGMGLLAGIGFTMSIFIALLSFNTPALQSEAKFAILIASVLAASAGYICLKTYSSKQKAVANK